MQSASTLLASLTDDDVVWLFSAGRETRVAGNTTLIRSEQEIEAIHFVLQGLLGVFLDEDGDRIALVGPGEILGEMSFVEGKPPSESVRTLEESVILSVPRQVLDEKLSTDASFSSRFFRGLARSLSERLRSANSRLAAREVAEGRRKMPGHVWEDLSPVLEQLKESLKRADNAALRGNGRVPTENSVDVRATFVRFYETLEQVIGEASAATPEVREEIGLRAQQELLPYLLLTKNAERMYSKPRGYAGDWRTVQGMYRNIEGGSGRVGPLFDRCFLETPPAVAVRNRRRPLVDRILELASRPGNEPVRIASLPCGPAEELQDVFDRLSDPSRLVATLLDVDREALAEIAEWKDRRYLRDCIRLIPENLVFLALGRRRVEIEPQDFVYSLGLIDSFDDDFAVRVLDWIHGILKPGGEVLVGTFHPSNPCRALMDHVLEWRLVHRSEADLSRLFQRSAFGMAPEVKRSEDGVGLLAECIRS